MLDERAEGDPLEGSRIMVAGTAEEAGRRLKATPAPALSERSPVGGNLCGFQGFFFFRIGSTGVHLVAGFGRIVDLRPEKILTES